MKDKIEDTFTLPPRRETRLAHYSRQSKLATVGLALVGLVSLSSLVNHYLPKDTSERHAPKILSADTQEKMSVVPSKSKGGTRGGTKFTASENGDAINTQDDKTIQMAPAPDPDLTETTAQGDLPKISEDGRQPWQIYARPFNAADKRPRLAIIVADLGLSRGVTNSAVSHLPANVTLAFDTQSPAIGAWCGRARQEGHEILLSVPMEPFDFPRSDPGPHALLTSLSNIENLEKLNWSLRQGLGYVGITTLSGSRFTTDSDKLKTVMGSLHDRGLMIVDAHVAPHSAVADLAHDHHVPSVVATQRIDENLSPEAIDAALKQLEQVARLNGRAVGIVSPLPVVIEHLQAWLKTLPQEGIALAPVSSIVQ
jgi:polysaccharide deacetylase 2 family uncharacterized protein YibQ